MIGIIKTTVAVALFLTYPYLIYQGLENGVAWLAPVLFSGLFIYQGLKADNLKKRSYKFIAALILLAGAYYLQSVAAKILPVLIQLMLLYFFARTLRIGPPIIESFVRLEFSELPPEIVRYCRQLTAVWAGFFAFNALMCMALALWSNDFSWTLYNGLLIYIMIGLLTTGEYIYRHFRFPDLAIPDPKSTLKNMVLNGRRIWQDIQVR